MKRLLLRVRAWFRRQPDTTPRRHLIRDADEVIVGWWSALTEDEAREARTPTQAPRRRWLDKRERPRW